MSSAISGFVPPVYPYDRLHVLEANAARHPGGIVDLSVGEPCERPTDAVLEALSSDGNENNYPSSPGSPALREAARDWIARRFGVTVSASELSMCIGTKEFVAGVPHWLRLRDPRKDTVLYLETSYPTYEMGALLAGCRPVPVPARPDGSLDLGAITTDYAAHAVCLWVNSPSNPTGALDDLEAAARFGRARDLLVLSDECYAEFTWQGPPTTILSGGHEGVLAVHSISKRSNAAGLRVGFYAGDEGLVHYLTELRRHAGFMVPTPIQQAGIVALNDNVEPAEQRKRYEERIGRFIDILASIGVKADPPRGSFYLWVKVPEEFSAKREENESAEWPFVRFLADNAGVLVAPGEFFGPAGSGFVRIALVEPMDRLELVAQRLDAYRSGATPHSN